MSASVDSQWNGCTPNKALHWMAIPLRSIATSELGRYIVEGHFIEEPKLSGKEIRDQIIQAGLKAIPYAGSPLASLYFGIKNEKRFKRLESFYRELNEELASTKKDIEALKNAKPDEETAAIVEELNTKIENEPLAAKREYYKIFFKSNVINSLLLSYEERRFFLESLDSLSVLDLNLLSFLTRQEKPIHIKSIQRGKDSPFQILGSINRLRNYGYASTQTVSIVIGSGEDNALNESVLITDYGRKFFSFALVES